MALNADAATNAVADREIEIDVQANLPQIKADPDAIGTALINLLENARKYCANGGHITVRARANNGSVVVSLSV